MSIHVQKALESQLEAGLHSAVVIKVSLKTKIGRTGAYVALNLLFSDEHGATATVMMPHFTGKIPTVFKVLGKPIEALADIEPEELMALRGCNAQIHVVHRPSNGKIYANVNSINGTVIA